MALISCSACGHIHNNPRAAGRPPRECYDCGVCAEHGRRKYEAEQKATDLVDGLGKFVNGMSREQADAFATALANEHPTLLGQIAKAVGTGVMRRAVRDPEWKAFDAMVPEGNRGCIVGNSLPLERHAEHDGRLDCTTVIGASIMARQSFV